MKIIFLKDVPRVGKKYETKEVADGYGRHLVMQGVAEIATKEVLARIQNKIATEISHKKANTELLLKNIDALKKTAIVIKGKANDKGHLFASIHKEEILAEIKRSSGLTISPECVILERPLKETGVYEIPVVVDTTRDAFSITIENIK